MIASPSVRRLLALLYLAGALILADQLADLAATLLSKPLAPGEAAWRFGVFGLVMTRTSVFLVADVMLFVAAIGLAHRKVLRSLGVLHLVLTLALLGGLGIFLLDWLQVRGRLPGPGLATFDLAGFRAAGMAAIALGLVGWAGLAALRATRSRARSNEDAAPLLMSSRKDAGTS